MKLLSLGVTSVAVAITTLVSGCGGAGTSTDDRTVSVTSRPSLGDAGDDLYAGATPSATSSVTRPSPTATDSQSPSLGDDNICEVVGQDMIEYSKLSEESGKLSITRLIDYELLVDLREDPPTPPADGVVIVISCDAYVEWSNGGKSALTMYFLLDSDGNYRIKWDDIRDYRDPGDPAADNEDYDFQEEPGESSGGPSGSGGSSDGNAAGTSRTGTFYLEVTDGCWSFNSPPSREFPIESPQYKTLYESSCDSPHHAQVIYADAVPSGNATPSDEEVVQLCELKYIEYFDKAPPTSASATAGTTYLRWFYPDVGPESKKYPGRVICYVHQADINLQIYSLLTTRL